MLPLDIWMLICTFVGLFFQSVVPRRFSIGIRLISRFHLDLYLLTLSSFGGVDLLVSSMTCYSFLWQWIIGFHSTFIVVPC